jgi:glycosyltransferase involved in cell wall biosynthesis
MSETEHHPDVTVVMTAHREGTLAHHTLRALRRCVQHAGEAGLSVCVDIVLDSPDERTASFLREAVGPEGYFADLCDARVSEVAVRDPGLGRNVGVARSRSRFVAVLDADNLPTANWLTEGVRVLEAAGSASVVHPERLVTFGERSEFWPQWPVDDERFNIANLYDRNYWDTVCIAHREVFEDFPYAATGSTGFGYEDWHFYSRTLHAGVAHLVASGTAYFYRIKPGDSVNAAHYSRGSVIPPTGLLTDTLVAERVLAAPTGGRRRRKRVRTAQARAVLRAWRAGDAPTPFAAPPSRRDLLLGLWLGSPVVPDHYRLLYADLAGMTDGELRHHYRVRGRSEGRLPRLRGADLAAVAPGMFDVRHYRLLHDDLAGFDDMQAVRHFLTHGRREGRRGLLGPADLKNLARLDVEDYRTDNPDLMGMSDDALVSHYLTYGAIEGRRPHVPDSERISGREREVPDELVEEWRALHELEPLIPVPTPRRIAEHSIIGPPADGSMTPASRVWWQVIDALRGARPKALLFAPWLRMGGADILVARYAQTLAELRPDWDILVVTTHGTSTTQDWMPERAQLIDLPSMQGYELLTPRERRELTVNLVVQLGPELVHVINSPEAFDGFEWCSRAMTTTSRVYLTTFVIDRGPDGDIFSHLAKRRAGYLDDAEGVIVDNHALVDQLVELYRFPRDKFHVHHQAVELPPRRPTRERRPGDPVKVLWAARFDRQKRLDVLADLAEAAAAVGLPVEWHVFGKAVIDSPDDTEEVLERLARAGATLHGTYSAENPLDYSAYDAFLLTSEAEGIPLTLLDVMAERLPVVASTVGGVPELIDSTTGFPVACHDDVDAYLKALREIVDSPAEAQARAEAGYHRLAVEYSWDAFKKRALETPGYLTARSDALVDVGTGGTGRR